MLTDAELQRIRVELGFNTLTVGAAPFVSVTALFETIIRTYLTVGARTTSSSSVTGNGTPLPITLADPTGFNAGDRVWLDVDARQESVTVQSLAGSVLTALFNLTHSGTYPVYVDGGEGAVRNQLAVIESIRLKRNASVGRGLLKRADDVEFYPATTGNTLFDTLQKQLMIARDELASILGAPNMWRQKQGGGGSRVALY
jgi:hypothetical protein